MEGATPVPPTPEPMTPEELLELAELIIAILKAILAGILG